jgi:hypothetical protein
MDRVRTQVRLIGAAVVFAAWILFGTMGALIVPPIQYAAGDIRGTTAFRVVTYTIIIGGGLVGLAWSVKRLRADRATRAAVLSANPQVTPTDLYTIRRESTIRHLADQQRMGEVAAEVLVRAWEEEAARRALDPEALSFWEEGASWIATQI